MKLSRAIVLGAAVVSVSGCATKEYVDERVAELDARMDVRMDETEARLDDLTATSRQALQRAEDAGVLARGKFLYTVVLNESGITFDLEDSGLSDGAKSQLNDLADNLKADNRNVYLEIQGHTDATGEAEYNQWLGLQRAEAVRRHLHTQGLALNRMGVISYGEDAPVEDNSSREGRALNRRVEVVVLN